VATFAVEAAACAVRSATMLRDVMPPRNSCHWRNEILMPRRAVGSSLDNGRDFDED
jgi:hypothetical protein